MPSFRPALVALFGAALLLAPNLAATAANRATFPKDFKQMVMYGDYRRGSGGELAYALKETIDIAKAGQPLPPGTRLVLEIYDDGALTSYFVMEKGVDWGLEVDEEKRTGDWHFQQFDINGEVNRAAIADRCESCHQSAANNDFMFTVNRMRDYLP
ncbi:cytochrome P460 family protein [Neorhizobium tomejilense]|uniref:cytochrome P460 family protein n=1 Tax=Neorhizobium tomejilense TaxID=2093828 RepID=UPI000CF97680|nr:cytochrome P460 family protein [Neorhizobium tomejilense]